MAVDSSHKTSVSLGFTENLKMTDTENDHETQAFRMTEQDISAQEIPHIQNMNEEKKNEEVETNLQGQIIQAQLQIESITKKFQTAQKENKKVCFSKFYKFFSFRGRQLLLFPELYGYFFLSFQHWH
jgi:hypothetical protein